MKYFISIIKGLIGLIVIFFTLTTHAEDLPVNSWREDIQFHGFAAQSYINTKHNNFFGKSTDGSYDFKELGLNSLWRPTASLQLAAQIVIREAGKTDDGDIRFDFAFFDYAFLNSETGASGVRLGRIVNPYGLYNDTRDVAATRPSILLPQSVYFDVNRNFALSSDGVQFYHQVGAETGYYNIQFGVFEPRTDDPDFEPAIFFQSVPGSLKGDTSWMGRVVYEYDLGRLRLGLTAGEVNMEYDPSSSDPIGSGKFHFRPYLASLQYSQAQWSLTMEYAKRTSELENFGIFPDTEFTGTSYFVQGSRRLLENLELFLRYDDLVWDDNDKDGKKFAEATGLPNYMRYAKDWTTGIKWDINKYFMLRAEWHRVKGTGWLSLLENPDPTSTQKDWDLFAVSISARF